MRLERWNLREFVVSRGEVMSDESFKKSRGNKESPHKRTWRDLSPKYHICSRWPLERSLLSRSERPFKRVDSASFREEVSSMPVRQETQGRSNLFGVRLR